LTDQSSANRTHKTRNGSQLKISEKPLFLKVGATGFEPRPHRLLSVVSFPVLLLASIRSTQGKAAEPKEPDNNDFGQSALAHSRLGNLITDYEISGLPAVLRA
jgi:hypothetical protein